MTTFLKILLFVASTSAVATPESLRSFSGLPKTFWQKKSLSTQDSCRAGIRAKLCLVELPYAESNEARPCVPGGEAYADAFEALHDEFPPVLQKVFCSIDVIYVETNFNGTGYGGTTPDRSKVVLGVKKSALDAQVDLATWASWKEQLSFGGITTPYIITSNLPQVRFQSSAQANGFLYFLIAHEFAHILDFANQINDVIECDETAEECPMKDGTWGSIGWATDVTPLPQNDFDLRSGLCFYWCGYSPLGRGSVLPIYDFLYFNTDFLSIYATTQPWDDFADSLAYLLLKRNLNASYTVDSRQGPTYDIMTKIDSLKFSRKRQYLEKFLHRTDLHYP